MSVNPNHLPALGDSFIDLKNVEAITPQSQPATPTGSPEDEPAVASPAEQQEQPVASKPSVGNLTPQEQTT